MILDSVRVSLMNYQRVVILKDKLSDRYINIWIGPAEADAIAVKLQNINIQYPLTHDTLCNIVNTTGCKFESTVISELKDDVFISKLVLTCDENTFEINCRTSDALAVAIRANIPIFIEDKLLKIYGTHFEIFNETVVPSSLDRFSEPTQDLMVKTEEEAKCLNSSYIGTGHILLAISKKVPTAAYEVLSNLGIELPIFSNTIKKHIVDQSDMESAESGLTAYAQKAIELSKEEAIKLGSNHIHPEHILLGLVRQNDGVAAKILKENNIDTEKIYIELIRIYTQQPSQPTL
jgi:bifunctional DNase/RNase